MHSSDFYEKRSALCCNLCLLLLKRKVCLMVSEFFSRVCSLSLFLVIRKLMLGGVYMSRPI